MNIKYLTGIAFAVLSSVVLSSLTYAQTTLLVSGAPNFKGKRHDIIPTVVQTAGEYVATAEGESPAIVEIALGISMPEEDTDAIEEVGIIAEATGEIIARQFRAGFDRQNGFSSAILRIEEGLLVREGKTTSFGTYVIFNHDLREFEEENIDRNTASIWVWYMNTSSPHAQLKFNNMGSNHFGLSEGNSTPNGISRLRVSPSNDNIRGFLKTGKQGYVAAFTLENTGNHGVTIRDMPFKIDVGTDQGEHVMIQDKRVVKVSSKASDVVSFALLDGTGQVLAVQPRAQCQLLGNTAIVRFSDTDLVLPSGTRSLYVKAMGKNGSELDLTVIALPHKWQVSMDITGYGKHRMIANYWEGSAIPGKTIRVATTPKSVLGEGPVPVPVR